MEGEVNTGLLSVQQVAEIAAVSRQTVYNWLKSEWLKSTNTAKGLRISRVDLDGFLASYKPAARSEPKTSGTDHEGAAG